MKIYGMTPVISALSSNDICIILFICILVLIFYIYNLLEENKELIKRLSYLEGVCDTRE